MEQLNLEDMIKESMIEASNNTTINKELLNDAAVNDEDDFAFQSDNNKPNLINRSLSLDGDMYCDGNQPPKGSEARMLEELFTEKEKDKFNESMLHKLCDTSEAVVFERKE